MEFNSIIDELHKLADPEIAEQKSKRGINPAYTLGIKVSELREIARKIGKNHELALKLYDTGIHEAKKLACLIDEPELVTEEQMEEWVGKFDSWDLCDTCCMNLFDRTKFLGQKIDEWALRPEEYIKRAGFVLIVQTVTRNKKAVNSYFENFFPLILRGSVDNRNFVKKAVSWALRQIGKRNIELNEKAVLFAEELLLSESPAARWIAGDALKELRRKDINIRNYGI